MGRFKVKGLIWILGLALKKIVENILVVVALIYLVFVFDIYINTDKLSKVSPAQYIEVENIAHNPKFTKGPVVFRVDKGTLVFRLNPYINQGSLNGYSPFFIFPHNRTIIIKEEVLKRDNLYLRLLIAHELGHIQGGLKHLGPVKEMERYADDFAAKVLKNQPQKEPQK